MAGDPVDSARADGHEPDDHHRPEQPSDDRGAEPLQQNSTTMITAVIGTTKSPATGTPP